MDNVIRLADHLAPGTPLALEPMPEASIQQSVNALSAVIAALVKLRRNVPGCDPANLLDEAQGLRDDLERLDAGDPAALDAVCAIRARITDLRDAIEDLCSQLH